MKINKALKQMSYYSFKIAMCNDTDLKKAKRLIDKIIKASSVLMIHNVLGKESIEMFEESLKMRAELETQLVKKFIEEQQHKLAVRENNKFFFIISDTKQVLGIGKNWLKLLRETIRMNCELLFGETIDQKMVNRKVSLVKGTKKASELLEINEIEFLQKTIKAMNKGKKDGEER